MPEQYDCNHQQYHQDHDACIQAKIAADGIPRCFMCGDTMTECDSRTDAEGFNECEWLAEK